MEPIFKVAIIFSLGFCFASQVLKADENQSKKNENQLKEKNLSVESGEYEGISYEIKLKADYIFEILRCPTCQNIPLKDSHSQIAENMKKLIIQKLQEGWTETQIVDYFVQRYGDEILLQPKTKVFYVLPVVFLISALALLFIFLVRKNKTNEKAIQENKD
jgi:Uncharacterized protein involved in biosynthesis of c-type cytochromes